MSDKSKGEKTGDVEIRGHELDDFYRYFVLEDRSTIFEEMLGEDFSYGEEFIQAYKELFDGLEPEDKIKIVDDFGTVCRLDGGCPNKEGSVCSDLSEAVDVEVTDDNKELYKKLASGIDSKFAEEYGLEVGEVYSRGELVEILTDTETPERLRKYGT